jgi:hypothetical protein
MTMTREDELSLKLCLVSAWDVNVAEKEPSFLLSGKDPGCHLIYDEESLAHTNSFTPTTAGTQRNAIAKEMVIGALLRGLSAFDGTTQVDYLP